MVCGKSGKNKNFIFQGQEKVREFFEKPKEIENEDRDIDGLQQKHAKLMLACITGIIFCIFRRAKSKREASEEHQTHVMRKGVLSVAPHSIYACLCTPSHAIEKITPVMQASKCKASLDCFFIYYSPNARSVKSRGIFEGQV